MTYYAGWKEDLSQLNSMEIMKLEKDGLDIIDEIEHLAKIGYDQMASADRDRLKWAGMYQQRGGEGYFLVRVRIPSGILSSQQARVLASLGRQYGRNLIDITTRQAIQLRYIRVEYLPDIFKRLAQVGLFSYESGGDCPRTIMGNPLAGIDTLELMDTTPLVEELQKLFLLNKDFSNLPRKFKISISASTNNSGHAQINDIAFTPAIKNIDGKEVVGFHCWVGGGLSATPQMAKKLDMFILPEKVVAVARGVATIFRDYGYRQSRSRARLKFLVADWGIERFQVKLMELVGEMPSLGQDMLKDWDGGFFTGVHPQKGGNLSYVGLAVPRGRMSARELEELAKLAENYGQGSLRTTASQNILITHVEEDKLPALLEEELLKRLSPQPEFFAGHGVSCTGKEFCTKAVVESKSWLKKITDYLDEYVAVDTPIRINISGCPSGCGQTQIADIGLQGTVIKTPKGSKDGFEIWLGGHLGLEANFAQKLKGRILAEAAPLIIAQLVKVYLEARLEGENFYQCVQRIGLAPFQIKYDELLKIVA